MAKIITFSGWGQPYNSLEIVANKAEHIKYSDFKTIESLFDNIKGKSCDLLIGWSLGGQIALRAVEEGIIDAKKILLLATPFCFLESNDIKFGMNVNSYNNFKNALTENYELGMRNFSGLIARNDEKQKEILKLLKEKTEASENWVYWLEELEYFNCSSIKFKNIDNLTLIHGRQDSVVDFSQTSLFMPFAPFATTKIIENCGHAPHFHSKEFVKEVVEKLL